jgi:hypothetical protein
MIRTVAICALLLQLSAQAQFPKEQAGVVAEVSRLAYCVGTWQIAGRYLFAGKPRHDSTTVTGTVHLQTRNLRGGKHVGPRYRININ